MAGEELQVVRLRDDFYRDGFYKVIFALLIIIAAIALLIVLSIFLHFSKPAPVNFRADPEWRIVEAVPLEQPYLNPGNLVQWVSESLPDAFTLDFVSYTKQLKDKTHYFTNNGWKKFLEIINNYANFNQMDKGKLFLNTNPVAAPVILNQGLLNDRYAWWVQMRVNLNFTNYQREVTQPLMLQVLVVRVPTLNNLYGVGIDNIMVINQPEAEANSEIIQGGAKNE